MTLSLPVTASAGQSASGASARSSPADASHPTHPATAQDYLHSKHKAPSGSGFIRNVDSSTGSFTEPSIAVNPANTNEIVVAAGFGGWNGGNAPLFVSEDGGSTFTRFNSIPPPPNGTATNGCPCDQAIDFGRDGTLYGTFLAFSSTVSEIYSGSTTDPTSAASWSWNAPGSPPTAQVSSINSSGTPHSVDQPWLLVNRDPTTAAQDNTYTAYDDFNGSPDMRVAVATGTQPPNFVRDNKVGDSGGGINPGHRLANDPTTGFMYDLWQQSPGGGSGGSQSVNYRLNRSTDGGQTWTLNGSGTGIVVANADSDQPTKFGTVNALLGGVDHAAVDPTTGDVYVVYGNRDSGTGNNRLSLARLQSDSTGNNMNVTATTFVTGQVQAALPSIAVASNGTIGILYDTFDGFSSTGLPIFTAHFAMSTDHGQSFATQTLETFLSPNKDNGNARQRNLGDYQQVKVAGRTFYGVFTGNAAATGGATSKMDPVFFKVSAGGPVIAVSGSLAFGTVARGTSQTRDLTIQNTGNEDLLVNGVSMASGSDPAFSVLSNPGVPQTIPPGGSVVFSVKFAPTASSSDGLRTGNVTISSSDPITPTVTVPVSGTVGVPTAVLSPGPLTFSATCSGTASDLTETVTNTGQADLTVQTASISGPDSGDFSVVNASALPVVVHPGSSYALTVRFTPSSGGPKSATLTITTDDPVTPTLTASLSGNGATSKIVAGSNSLNFGGVAVDDRTSPSTVSLVLAVFNQSDCPLTVNSLVAATAPEFTLSGPPTTPTVIGAHNELDLTLVFNPSAAGARSGSFSLASTDPATPVLTVALAGTGLLPTIGTSTNRIVFPPTVVEPTAAGLGGTTSNLTVTNTGQAELIMDSQVTSGVPFSVASATSPPSRYSANTGFNLPVTFHPSGSPTSTTYNGTLTLTDNGPTAVSTVVQLCGEAVGRGIRVTVVNKAGTPYSKVDKLQLQPHGVTGGSQNINLKNLALVTRTTCAQIRYQYDNELLPATDTTNPRGSYYALSVSVGNKSTNVVFTLGIAEFKSLVVTVG
ncbi:MAG: choice-of-anchor D domain-containing protein [Frankiaceae bacterium]